jgi:hypothetical protein
MAAAAVEVVGVLEEAGCDTTAVVWAEPEVTEPEPEPEPELQPELELEPEQ